MRSAALGFLCAWTTACADGPDFDAIVDDHRDELDVAISDCGTLQPDDDCAERLTAAEQCFVDAFAACEPAELRIDSSTVEGDPIPRVLFVEPTTNDGCEVVEFTDNSADEFKGDYGDVTQSACTSAVAMSFDASAGTCARIVVDGCETVREW